MRFHKEKNRLITVLALILTMGFLTTSLLSYYVSSDSVHRNIIDQQLPLSSDNVYSEIQHDLFRPIHISMQMAQNTFLRDWILSGEKNSDKILRYLAENKSKFSISTSFLASDITHRYYYAEGILTKIDENNLRDQWFYRLKKGTELYVIDVDTDKEHHNTPTAFINYKVFDYHGRFIAVTGVGITFDYLQRLIQHYEEKYKRRVYFLDQDGAIVLAGNAMNNVHGSIRALPDINKIAPTILNQVKTPVRLSYNLEGATIQLNSRYIPELKWYLIVEENEAASVLPLRNILGANLLISSLVTALVLLITHFTVNRFQSRLEHFASTDALSGLFNREMGEILFEQTIHDALRFKQLVSIALLDVDYFKQVNDTYGHNVGDTVIKELGNLLRSSGRRNDIVIRWGGEEFLVIRMGSAVSDTLQWAEKIRERINSHDFLPLNQAITVSIGVTEFRANDTRTELFARVDKALYVAKTRGRNRVEAYDDTSIST